MFDIPFKEVLKGDTIINSCDEVIVFQSKDNKLIVNVVHQSDEWITEKQSFSSYL